MSQGRQPQPEVGNGLRIQPGVAAVVEGPAVLVGVEGDHHVAEVHQAVPAAHVALANEEIGQGGDLRLQRLVAGGKGRGQRAQDAAAGQVLGRGDESRRADEAQRRLGGVLLRRGVEVEHQLGGLGDARGAVRLRREGPLEVLIHDRTPARRRVTAQVQGRRLGRDQAEGDIARHCIEGQRPGVFLPEVPHRGGHAALRSGQVAPALRTTALDGLDPGAGARGALLGRIEGRTQLDLAREGPGRPLRHRLKDVAIARPAFIGEGVARLIAAEGRVNGQGQGGHKVAIRIPQVDTDRLQRDAGRVAKRLDEEDHLAHDAPQLDEVSGPAEDDAVRAADDAPGTVGVGRPGQSGAPCAVGVGQDHLRRKPRRAQDLLPVEGDAEKAVRRRGEAQRAPLERRLQVGRAVARRLRACGRRCAGDDLEVIASGLQVHGAAEVQPLDGPIGPARGGRALDGEIAPVGATQPEEAALRERPARKGHAAQDHLSGTGQTGRLINEKSGEAGFIGQDTAPRAVGALHIEEHGPTPGPQGASRSRPASRRPETGSSYGKAIRPCGRWVVVPSAGPTRPCLRSRGRPLIPAARRCQCRATD